MESRPYTVEIVDSVADYVEYMKEIFDFAAIKDLLHGAKGRPLKVLINAMHGGKLYSTLITAACICTESIIQYTFFISENRTNLFFHRISAL